MGGWHVYTFFQRTHTDGQQTHEYVLNITNHQRNANQNYNEIPPHTYQNGYHQKATNNKCQWGCGEKEIFVHCWWECKLIQPLWRTIWRFLKKTKNRTTTWPSNPTPGHKLGENQNLKRNMHPNVHYNTIYNSRTWKQPICPARE